MEAPTPLPYSAEFEFAHGVRLRLQMFDHHEHRWHWTHRYAPRVERAAPEIVCDTRVTVSYLDGALKLPLKVCMNVVIPARLGQRVLYGVDVSPGAKTYVEFHYADPDEDRTLRLTRIEVGALKFIDMPRAAHGAGLVRPPMDFPFPVLEQLPLTRGAYYCVPVVAEDGPAGAGQWPTLDIRAHIGGTAWFAPERADAD